MPDDKLLGFDDTASNSVSAVKVKPPPFLSNNPKTWFAVLEAQFQLAKITQDETRFYHAVAALPVHVLTDVVGDIVDGSYTLGDYGRLKSRLVSAFTESEASRLAARTRKSWETAPPRTSIVCSNQKLAHSCRQK